VRFAGVVTIADRPDVRQTQPQPAAHASKGPRILKGALIGAGIGAVLWLTPMTREACIGEPRWNCAAKGAVLFGSFGAVVAWRLK
jgi:hypothetical protein